MDILLSIRPENVNKILSGVKKFEFRREVYKKDTCLDYIYIYSSSSEKRIVARFQVGELISASPDELWEVCGDSSGTSKERLLKYFQGKDKGYAIGIKNLQICVEPLNPWKCFENFVPPQSFCYVRKDHDKMVLSNLTYYDLKW